MKKNRKWVIVGLVVFALMCCPMAFAADTVSAININTADPATLTQLKGIGDKYADAIVQYRETNGPFAKAEDIVLVPGIGQKTYEQNKDRITVAGD